MDINLHLSMEDTYIFLNAPEQYSPDRKAVKLFFMTAWWFYAQICNDI